MAIKSQADMRRDQIYEDQFGRPWLVAIELRTGDPTGYIAPAGWTDELRIPQQYLRVPRDKYGQPKMGRLQIAFDEWRLEVERANQEWKTHFFRIGNKVYGMKFDPHTAESDEYLMALAGPKPHPTLEMLDRAMRNDTTTVLDERANERETVLAGETRIGRPRKG